MLKRHLMVAVLLTLVLSFGASSCAGFITKVHTVFCPYAETAQNLLTGAKNDLVIAKTYLDSFVGDAATVNIPGVGLVTKQDLMNAISMLMVTLQQISDELAVACPPQATVEELLKSADLLATQPLVTMAMKNVLAAQGNSGPALLRYHPE